MSRLLKIIGLFCRISSLCRALLQKRPMILRSLLIVAIPLYIRVQSIAFGVSFLHSQISINVLDL